MKRLLIIIVGIGIVCSLLAISFSVAAHGATTHQIAPGTSLSSIHVVAGDTYEFQRGSTYTGAPLNVNADNVTISDYGTASTYPVFKRSTEGNDITLSGSSDTVTHIRLEGKGYSGKNGYEIGIDVSGDNEHITADKACGTNTGVGDLYAGVYLESSDTGTTVSNLVVLHCDALNPSNLGSGAFGVLIWGDGNTVTNSSFTDQNTPSPDFGTDGSGVEIYNGANNLIENSTGSNDVDFTELGSDRSAVATGNTYNNIQFTAPGEFLVTRGSGDKNDGPVFNTTVTNVTAQGAVVSYDWRNGDGTLLSMGNSCVASLSQDGGFVDLGGNTFTC